MTSKTASLQTEYEVTGLSDDAAIIADVLREHGSNWCYPSLAHFQRETGYCFTQIADALLELEARGLIEVAREASPYGTDLYRMLEPGEAPAAQLYH